MRLRLTGVFLLLVGLGGWLHVEYPWGTWRYRVTVVVDTPEGVKSGSAVREVRVHTEPGLLGVSKQGVSRQVGEAVVVDFGEKGALFVLPMKEEITYAFPFNKGVGVLAPEGIRFYNGLQPGAKAPLPRDKFPRLVMFEDLKDPKSVKMVDPDALSETFGKGVVLKDISAEITNDPVTWGIVDQFLPSSYYKVIKEGWRQLSSEEKRRLVTLTTFKAGD